MSRYNKQLLKPENKLVAYNCRVKDSWPLDNKCLTLQLIYQADVTNSLDDEYKCHLGLVETTFKKQYGNRKVRLKIKLVKPKRNCRNVFGN